MVTEDFAFRVNIDRCYMGSVEREEWNVSFKKLCDYANARLRFSHVHARFCAGRYKTKLTANSCIALWSSRNAVSI